MEKREIRERILEQRNKLTPEEVSAASKVICSRIAAHPRFEEAKLVMCYMDFRNEVMTLPLIQECLLRGKRVALPRVGKRNDQAWELSIHEIVDLARDCRPGTFGIPEPVESLTAPVDEKTIDFVVVPGVAFDLHKHRIGYGAGFYDRFLRRVRPDCFKAAAAFDLQVVDKLPAEEHDIPVDAIVTETRWIL